MHFIIFFLSVTKPTNAERLTAHNDKILKMFREGLDDQSYLTLESVREQLDRICEKGVDDGAFDSKFAA